MRENISTIFAIIIGVVVLIIFPLFSIMSRQDSISYNRVLTLTTEFVDSVRTKGYFTEQEYTDYLVKLANTNNTYNVQMEYHKKILINDINNISEEPVYVEDTLVYYNKDINSIMLQNNGKIQFNENDEFYIKIYNTNITTASLLYNYFARVSVPPKVINIGYGGKVSHITGVHYAETDFTNSYSPYIKLGEVLNLNGENNEVCFDSNAGTYDIKTCIRLFNLSEPKNQTITVPFEMYNFENIIKYSENGSREIKQVSNLQEFEDNKNYVEEAIQNLVTLRGVEVEAQQKQYVVDIVDIQYEKGVIKGTIKISNINLPQGASTKSSNIVIGQGLGTGPTGIVAAENRTHEIVLTKIFINPELQILGPFTTQEISNITTTTFEAKKTAYFKVKMIDYESKMDIQLRDLDTNELIDPSEYTINYVEEVTNKEYWIKLTYYSLFDKDLTLEITTNKPADNATEENITEDITAQSTAFKYESVDWGKTRQWFNHVLQDDTNISFIIRIETDDEIFLRNEQETERFVNEIKEKLNLQIMYYSNIDNPGYDLNYSYTFGETEIITNKMLDIKGTLTMNFSSITEPINKTYKMILKMNTISNEEKTSYDFNVRFKNT